MKRAKNTTFLALCLGEGKLRLGEGPSRLVEPESVF